MEVKHRTNAERNFLRETFLGIQMRQVELDIKLTKEEALVLFEWIVSSQEKNEITFSGEAEKHVFWRIEGQLEKLLPEIFLPNYHDLLALARNRVLFPG